MRFRQIKNLLSIRNSYHPILSKLFRKYGRPVQNVVINVFVGVCCIFLLFVAFLGLQYFFSTISGVGKMLLVCSLFSFSFSLFITIRSVYSFLYSGKDSDLLKTLPVTRGEIVLANVLYFYKKQIFVSFYLFASAMLPMLKETKFFSICVACVIAAIVFPLMAILVSVIFSFIAKNIEMKFDAAKRWGKLYFQKDTCLHSLVKYEFRNLLSFSSLKFELLSQLFCFVCFVFISINRDIRFLGLLLIFPAISMINISSFSREGDFHSVLESLPISGKKRILAKVIFYCVITLPLFAASFIFIAYTKNEYSLLLKLLPITLFVINTSLLGVTKGKQNLNVRWTNPQEAFRLDLFVIVINLLLGFVTSFTIFFIKDESIGIICATVLNISFFVLKLIMENWSYR